MIAIKHRGKIRGRVSPELFPRSAMRPFAFVRFLGVLAMVSGVEHESETESTVELVTCSPAFVLEESLRRDKLRKAKP